MLFLTKNNLKNSLKCKNKHSLYTTYKQENIEEDK